MGFNINVHVDHDGNDDNDDFDGIDDCDDDDGVDCVDDEADVLKTMTHVRNQKSTKTIVFKRRLK